MKITGAKGGSSGGDTSNHGTEIASIAYMKMLLALSEGEVEGGITGQKIFLNGTPLIDDNGTENFPGISWEFRNGTQDQDYIKGFPAVENEVSVGFDMKYGTPWVKSINNTQLSAIRIRVKFASGVYSMRESGGKDGYKIEYAVEISTDGSTYTEIGRDAADGIANTGYERSYRVDLPTAVNGWQIRVRRLTAEKNDGRHAEAMRIESMTEIVDAKLSYPNTALLFIQFDSKLFDGQTPTVTVLMKGMRVRVPTNYDPVARTYNGAWDGTFKFAWTNNVVWQIYDLLLKERYGTGKRLTVEQVDKWSLYKIAQYQDMLVSDGMGGQEVRSMCDLYITSRPDAWQVLMDMVSTFQGMMGWSNNLLTIDADMPRPLDPDFVFSKANIVGSFKYSGSSERTNYSAGIGTYSNPANHYNDDQASTFVAELARRYGFNQLEMTAVGCTRESETQRRLLWAIHTNSDDNLVEFNTGQEGRIPRLGKIIGVNNAPLAGRSNGGRISAAAGTKITLDREITGKPGDRLIVNLPSGMSQSRGVKSVSGRGVTIDAEFSETPAVEAAWVLDQTDLAIEQYRVSSITVNDDRTVTIAGIPYNPNKFPRIDDGAIIEDRPVTVVPPRGQSMPKNIKITSTYRVEQGIGISTMEVSWEPAANAIAYEAQWRQDNGNWINVGRTGNTLFSVDGIYTGRYVVRVRAVNALDITSMWATSEEVTLQGKSGKPKAPVALTPVSKVFGVSLSWGFPVGAEDALKTVLQYSLTADGSNPMLLADVPYPQRTYEQVGLRAGVRMWYRAKMADKHGNESDFTAWVEGQSSSDAAEILTYLTGQINSTQLSKDLRSEIDNLATSEAVDSAVSEAKSEASKQVADAKEQAKKQVEDAKSEATKQVSDAVQQTTDQVTAVKNLAAQQIDDAKKQATQQVDAVKLDMVEQVKIVRAETSEQVADVLKKAGDQVSEAKKDAEKQLATEVEDRLSGDAEEARQRSAGLQAEAGARADALLNEKNERTADITQVKTLVQNTSESLVQQISQIAAGSGEQFDTLNIWYFDTNNERWSEDDNGQVPMLVTDDGWLKASNSTSTCRSPNNLVIDANAYRFIKMRIKKVGSPVWAGKVYWIGKSETGWTESRSTKIIEPEYDANGVATLTLHDIDWRASEVIRRFRFDFLKGQTASDYLLIDWIAVGRPTPGAGMAALQEENTARVKADAAEAANRNTLAVQLRGAYDGTDISKVSAGLIYSERQSRVTADEAEATERRALQTSVNGSLSQIDNQLTALSTATEANAKAVTGLRSDVDTKASAEALNSLSTRVSETESGLTSQGSSISQINVTLGRETNMSVNVRGTGAPGGMSTITAPDGTVLYRGGRSYNVVTFRTEDDGSTSIDTKTRYDVFNSADNGAALRDALSIMPAGTQVIIFTADEPRTNAGSVADAVELIGGTASMVRNLKYRSAYVVIGRRGMAAGTAIEMQSATAGSGDTMIDVPVTFRNGLIQGLGSGSGTAVNTAANASAIQELNGRVTETESGVTSANAAITKLENGLSVTNDQVAGKADASALQTLSNTVTQQGKTLSSQGSSITKLENGLSTANTTIGKKADATALQTLNNTVTGQGKTLSSQGSSITAMTNSVSDLGRAVDAVASNPGNMLVNPSFERQFSGWTGNDASWSVLAAQYPVSGKNIAQCGPTGGTTRISQIFTAKAGRTYRIGVSVRRSTDLTIRDQNNTKIRLGNKDSGVLLRDIQLTLDNMASASSWSFVSMDYKPATDVGVDLSITVNTSAGYIYFDDAVVIDITDSVAIEATGTALQSLTNTVTSQGDTLSSQGRSITQLENGLSTANTAIGKKADGTALQSLSNTVTDQGKTLSSQGSSITQLENGLTTANTAIGKKADGTALQSLSNTVTDQGKTLSSQGGSITQLQNSLAATDKDVQKKADASALQSLATTVNQQGEDLKSESVRVSALENSLSTGNEILNGDFQSGVNQWADSGSGSSFSWDSVNRVLVSGAGSMRVANTGMIRVEPGQKITLMFRAKTSAGYTGGNQDTVGFIADLKNPIAWALSQSAWLPAEANVWKDYTLSFTVPDDAKYPGLYLRFAVGTLLPSGTTLSIDDVLVFLSNGVAALSAASSANAKSLDQLTQTVTKQDDKLSSQARSILQLENNLTSTNTAVGKKADATALQTLNNTVVEQGKTLSSQGSNITQLQNGLASANSQVDKKADASALQSLTNTVTHQGEDITSQSSRMDRLQSTLSTSNRDPENLLINSGFDGGDIGWTVTGSAYQFDTSGGVSSASPACLRLLPSGNGQLVMFSQPVSLKASRRYRASCWYRFSADAVIGDTANTKLRLGNQASGSVLANQNFVVSNTDWTEISFEWQNGNAGDIDGTLDARGRLNAGFLQIDNLVITDITDALRLNAAADGLSKLDLRVSETESGLKSDGVNITQLQNGLKSANTDISKKADASALQTLNNTVVDQGKTLSSQGSSITQLQNGLTSANTAIGKKADATALQSLNNTVVDQGKTLSSQGSSITQLQNGLTSANTDIGKKADASALQKLSNTVTEQGSTLSSQGNSLTTMTNSVSDLVRALDVEAATPGNMLVNPSFERQFTGWSGNDASWSILAAVYPGSGKNIAQCGPTGGASRVSQPFSVVAGRTYRIGISVRRSSDLVIRDINNTKLRIGNKDTGVQLQYVLFTMANLPTSSSTWSFIYLDYKADADLKIELSLNVSTSAGYIYFDDAVAIDITDAVAIEATGTALQSLNNTVSKQGDTLSSQGSSITFLENGLSSANSAISKKADSSALQSLSNAVTDQGKTLSSQGSSITQLENGLSTANTAIGKKADATALQSLSNTVTEQGGMLTTQGSSLTQINSVLSQETNIYLNVRGTGAPGGMSTINAADGSLLYRGGRSYNVVTFKTGADGSTSIATKTTYDVFTSPANGESLKDALAAMPVGTQVIIFTADEPRTNAASVAEAVELIGGTASVVRNLKYRSAYVVIGRRGMAAGTAIEMQSATAGSGDTMIDVPVTFRNGLIQGLGSGSGTAANTAANASAIQELNGRVTETESGVTSASKAITILENGLSTANTAIGKKADASALQTLNNTVAEQGKTLSSQGSSITTMTNSVSDLARAIDVEAAIPGNMLVNPSFERQFTGWNGNDASWSVLAAQYPVSGKNIAQCGPSAGATRIGQIFNAISGRTYRVGVSVRRSTDLVISDKNNTKIRLGNKDTGALLKDVFLTADNMPTGNTWGIVSLDYKPASDTGIDLSLSVGTSSGFIYFDDVFVIDVTDAVAIDATGQALQSLTNTVSSQGDTLSSQGRNITQLQNDLSSVNTAVGKKADATALQLLSNSVKSQGDTLSSQGSSITQLQNDLSSANTAIGKKADATALQSLSNTVTEQGNTLSSQAGKVTLLENNLVTGNRILNGDFSTGTDSWEASGSGSSFTWDTGSKSLVSGNGSLRVANRTAVRVERGQRVNLLFRVKTSAGYTGGNQDTVGFIADLSKPVDWVLQQSPWLPATAGQWESKSYSFDVPANAPYSEIYLRFAVGTLSPAGVQIYIDDVFVFVTNQLADLAEGISANSQAITTISGKVTQTEKDITSTNSAVTQLQSGLSSANTAIGKKADSSAVESLSSTVKQQGDKLTAQGNNLSSLSSSVEGNKSDISSLTTTLANLDEAVTTQIETLSASSRNNAETTLQQMASGVQSDATISQLAEVVANNDIASSRKVETLTAQLNDTKSQVQTAAAAITKLDGSVSASYSVKVGVTASGEYYGAGFGLGISNESGSLQSQFLVTADTFAILPSTQGGSGNAATAPFIASGGQVFINNALVQDGTITNAKIGSFIQSTNYVSGKTGWNINKSGIAEFNNVTVRGTFYASGGNFSNVTIDDSCTVKGTVYAEKIIGDVVSVGVWGRIQSYGVNGSQKRYFNGGLPYESVLMVPSPGLYTGDKIGGAGSVYINVNGVRYFSGTASAGTRYDNAIVVNVPANQSVEVEFGITGAASGQFWGSSGDIAVMVFRKGQNRFSDQK